MKLNRTYLFIVISSIALVIVLIIQVNWILQAAKVKEELFNEKAIMVLSKTAAALSSDTAAVKKMEVCVGRSESHKIDSLLRHYMKFYNVAIDYYFEVKRSPEPIAGGHPASDTVIKNGGGLMFIPNSPQPGCYQACVGGGDRGTNGLELKLVFPDKEEFIIQEMGVPFITSVILIVVVLIMFWRTVLLLLKEKEISQHTTDFLNNMTHEFKTPLTNIALAGKMMIKDQNVGERDKVKHYSGIILSENEKLRLQVEHVLSMTALERGEIPLQRTELDFHQLIREALKCISVQIENVQGHLELNLNAERFVIIGDKTHLTNAVCNLIDNAVKYSAEKPELTVQTSNSGRNLVVTVSDNGIGIEEKYREKVFDMFFRVPTGDIHNVKGFGLGLAYTKKIIELHGGTITLQSEKGEGTTFTITLPHG
jgi:two-component system phosphate regulon sensor histidine kinase PhoR